MFVALITALLFKLILIEGVDLTFVLQLVSIASYHALRGSISFLDNTFSEKFTLWD